MRNCNDIQRNTIDLSKFQQDEIKLYNERNYYVKKTSSNFRKSYQLSVAISKLQGLTNALRVCIIIIIIYTFNCIDFKIIFTFVEIS